MEKAKILLVDDEEDFAKNMKRLLENRGHAVTILNSGEGAVSVLGNGGRYDVMILDLKMPGMNGLATLNEMKKQNLKIQTLVLTGHGDIGTALEALKLGSCDYLTKPCEIDELEAKLDELWMKNNGKKSSMMGKLLNRN
jgi:DNA-binding NtrC family response regulator